MAKMKVANEYKELAAMFESLTGARNLWQVFNDCIEMYALAIQNTFAVGKKFENNESRYKQIASQYTIKELEIVVKILSKIINMADENPFRDLLGNLYMQLNMGSDALGQFFTPYNLSKLMAAISIDIETVKKDVAEHGFTTINEPTVGGGANIIAACEILKMQGINYQRDCVIVCQDLNRLTALMCYVMLSLLGCAAVVKIGDTLSDPFTNYAAELQKGSEIWTTPMFHVYNCYFKV